MLKRKSFSEFHKALQNAIASGSLTNKFTITTILFPGVIKNDKMEKFMSGDFIDDELLYNATNTYNKLRFIDYEILWASVRQDDTDHENKISKYISTIKFGDQLNIVYFKLVANKEIATYKKYNDILGNRKMNAPINRWQTGRYKCKIESSSEAFIYIDDHSFNQDVPISSVPIIVMQKEYQKSDILLPVQYVNNYISYDYIGPYFECSKVLFYMSEIVRSHSVHAGHPGLKAAIESYNHYLNTDLHYLLYMAQSKNRFAFNEYISDLARYLEQREDNDIDIYCKRFIASKIMDDKPGDLTNYTSFINFVRGESEINDDLYYTGKLNYEKLSNEEYLYVWECIDAKHPAESKLNKAVYTLPKLGNEIYIYPAYGIMHINNAIHFYKKFCHIVKKPKGAPINTWIRGKFAVTDSSFIDTSTNELMLNAMKRQHFEEQNIMQYASFNLIMQKRVEKSDIIFNIDSMSGEALKIYDHIGENFIIDAAYFYVEPFDPSEFDEYTQAKMRSHELGNVFMKYIESDMKNYNDNTTLN